MPKQLPIIAASLESINQSLRRQGLVWTAHDLPCGVRIWTPAPAAQAVLEGRDIRPPDRR